MAKPRLSNSRKRQVASLVDQAVRAVGAGRKSVCEQLCGQIEVLHPGNADAANIRGIIAAQSGEFAQAVAWIRRAIEASPKRPEFYDNLGKLYSSRQMYVQAAELYHAALQIIPDARELQLSYCAALIQCGDAAIALPILQQLSDSQPDDLHVLMGVYSALFSLARYEEALACLEGVLERVPTYFEAHFEKARLLMQLGRLQEAEQELRIALGLNPSHAATWSSLATLKTFRDAADADKQSMQALYDQSQPGSDERVVLSFALAKACEDLGLYGQAFDYYREGNTGRQARSTFDLDAELAHMHAVIAHYTPQVMQQNSGLDDARPVFIVGMPRSGSSLVEQILAAHPSVAGRGEWNAFERVLLASRSLDNPLTLDEMAGFSSEQWGGIGQAYLDLLDEGPQGLRITDKTLINYRLIGAIHCALPQARFVHVRRHPLDNCLSIFRANMQGENFDFGFELESLGRYYLAYRELMQHWREVLPEGVMYELDYEQLVADQEGETRKLLAACGLPWEDDSLNFTEADHVVGTSSVVQVRKKIYSHAVQRWKHYEQQLQPLLRILGNA